MDKIVYMIDNVSLSDFQKLKDDLGELEYKGKLSSVVYRVGTGISEYHYNLHIGHGEGAVFIGWQHNASRPVFVGSEKLWDMKIEYNPSKLLEWHTVALRCLQSNFVWHDRRLITIDLCVDIEVHKDSIFVFARGKEENRYRGDRYYGYKSNHGHLKVYDKKRERKEKAGIDVFPEDEMYRDLTRIEYTLKFDKGINYAMFKLIDPLTIASEYQFKIINDINGLSVKAEYRACILAVLWGQMQVKQFSRYTRPHIEKALADCEELALGSLAEGSWKTLLNSIHKNMYEL